MVPTLGAVGRASMMAGTTRWPDDAIHVIELKVHIACEIALLTPQPWPQHRATNTERERRSRNRGGGPVTTTNIKKPIREPLNVQLVALDAATVEAIPIPEPLVVTDLTMGPLTLAPITEG